MDVQWLEQNTSAIPSHDEWLSSAEQSRLSIMRVAKRRADWRLGRWTAKLAVSAYFSLDHDERSLARTEILATESGAPWVLRDNERIGVSISISHRAGRAVAALAPTGTMLGCDLEVVEPRSDAFLSDYFTPDEQELIARASRTDRDRIATLLWSAKESALKALQVGLRVDCRTVNVSALAGLRCQAQARQKSIENEVSECASASCEWNSFRVECPGGRNFQGWWQESGLFLRTLVASPATNRDEIHIIHVRDGLITPAVTSQHATGLP